MDYEKKYREAQKWMESIYSELSHEQQMEAEAVFPELKESEDEKMMHQLHSWMREFGGAEEYTEKVYTWLKSLLEKQGEQKFAWSEEDEEYLRRAINAVKNTYPMTANWLKSLKERYTWKPSDAQMGALHDLNLTGNISYVGQGQVLIELYNDLKKLTE